MTTLLTKLFIKNPDAVGDVRVRSAYGTMVSVVCIVLNLMVAAGKITVGSYDNRTTDAKRLLGYVPEMPAVYDLLTVGEHLDSRKSFG